MSIGSEAPGARIGIALGRLRLASIIQRQANAACAREILRSFEYDHDSCHEREQRDGGATLAPPARGPVTLNIRWIRIVSITLPPVRLKTQAIRIESSTLPIKKSGSESPLCGIPERKKAGRCHTPQITPSMMAAESALRPTISRGNA